MKNFEFQNPTKIIFGRGTEEKVGDEVAVYSKNILLHFGSGSIKASGLYDRVTDFPQESGRHLGGTGRSPAESALELGSRRSQTLQGKQARFYSGSWRRKCDRFG